MAIIARPRNHYFNFGQMRQTLTDMLVRYPTWTPIKFLDAFDVECEGVIETWEPCQGQICAKVVGRNGAVPASRIVEVGGVAFDVGATQRQA